MHLQLDCFCNDDFENLRIQNLENSSNCKLYAIADNMFNFESILNKYSIHDKTTIILEKTLKLFL